MGGLFSYFRAPRQNSDSASIAKERLQIVVAQARGSNPRHQPDYIPVLKKELLMVIGKYISVTPKDVQVTCRNQDGCDFLEVNVSLPEDSTT